MKKLFCLLILVLAVDAEAGIRKLKQSTDTTVNIHLVNASTGSGITGATLGSVTGFIRKHADTTSSTVTAFTFSGCTALGLGAYNCPVTAAQTDTLGDWTLCYNLSSAVEQCDTYEVSSTADPEFAGDFASIADILAEACADATQVGSWGKRLCDNLDAQVSAVPAALMGTTVEVNGATNETFQNFLRYGAAMLFSNYTSSSGNFSFKSMSGSKNRVVYSTTSTSRTVTSRDATD